MRSSPLYQPGTHASQGLFSTGLTWLVQTSGDEMSSGWLANAYLRNIVLADGDGNAFTVDSSRADYVASREAASAYLIAVSFAY